MLQDGKMLNSAAPTDIEGLGAQFAALREDMMTLSRSVAAMAGRRGRRMGAEISGSLGEAIHYAERKGQSAEAGIERGVATHPLLALGLAAGLGLIIGAMTRR